MDSSKALKYHFKTFTMAGLWPKEGAGSFHFYHIWTVVVFLVLGLLFPFSQILNIFFANSIMEMVDRSVITSSVVVVVIKALSLYANRKGFSEFLELLQELDGEITEVSHITQLNSAIKVGHRLYFTYLYPYVSTCVLLIFQTIYSRPEIRLWSSTYAYPFEWAQQTHIYVSGLFIQGISNTCIVIFAVAADTYGVVLIHIVSTHISILHDRLERLGKSENQSTDEHYNELIQCCKIYERILRSV